MSFSVRVHLPHYLLTLLFFLVDSCIPVLILPLCPEMLRFICSPLSIRVSAKFLLLLPHSLLVMHVRLLLSYLNLLLVFQLLLSLSLLTFCLLLHLLLMHLVSPFLLLVHLLFVILSLLHCPIVRRLSINFLLLQLDFELRSLLSHCLDFSEGLFHFRVI